MVQVLVDLLVVTVLLEQATQHTGAADPQNLGGQTCLPGTVALTCSVSAGSVCFARNRGSLKCARSEAVLI